MFKCFLAFIRNATILALLLTNLFSCFDIDPPSKPTIAPGRYLLVATTDFSSGSVSVINMNSLEAIIDVVASFKDNAIAVADSQAYVINRSGSDNITKLNAHDSFSILFEESVGSLSNPQDIEALNNSVGLVCLYNKSYLQAINLTSGALLASKNISLSAYADADGIPEASSIIREGAFAYVALQNLDRNAGVNQWQPATNGKLIKINATTLSAVALTDMPFANPYSQLRVYTNNAGERIVYLSAIGQWGFSNSANDGGVVAYNLSSSTYDISPFSEAQAGNKDISDVIIVSDNLGFAILTNKSQWQTSLVRFNPMSHVITEVIIAEAGAFIDSASSIYYESSKLFVSSRLPASAGIRVFDTSSSVSKELTKTAIYVGLPPNRLSAISVY